MTHWLDFFIRSMVMFFTVFLSIRLLGKRIMANLTPMDRVSNITYGTVAGSVAVNSKIPVYGGIIVIGSFAIISWVIGKLVVQVPALRTILTGTPRPLIADGVISSSQLKKADLSEEDLAMRLRELKIANPGEVQLAQLETDGKIGLIPKHSS